MKVGKNTLNQYFNFWCRLNVIGFLLSCMQRSLKSFLIHGGGFVLFSIITDELTGILKKLSLEKYQPIFEEQEVCLFWKIYFLVLEKVVCDTHCIRTVIQNFKFKVLQPFLVQNGPQNMEQVFVAFFRILQIATYSFDTGRLYCLRLPPPPLFLYSTFSVYG